MIIVEIKNNLHFPNTPNYFLYCPKCKKKNFWLKQWWKVNCVSCSRKLPRHDKLLFSLNARLHWHQFDNWMDK